MFTFTFKKISMKKQIIYFSFGLLSFGLLSCSKTEINPAYLTAKSWIPTSYELKGVEKIRECEKDDTLTYKTNGFVELKAGGVQCDMFEIPFATFNYSLDQKNATLTLGVNTHDVIILDANTLKIEKKSDGSLYTFRH